MGLFTAGSDTARWALVAMTAAIAIFVAVWLWREKQRQDALALSLVLGGALGNIVDRVRLGYVVDYADLHFGDISPFLVFNVADAAITIGVLLLLVRALLTRDKAPAREESEHA
jgi:signal peptidase II